MSEPLSLVCLEMFGAVLTAAVFVIDGLRHESAAALGAAVVRKRKIEKR